MRHKNSHSKTDLKNNNNSLDTNYYLIVRTQITILRTIVIGETEKLEYVKNIYY